jgi:hypothetical protein
MVDILKAMEEDDRAMQRMASAFEVIADTLTAMYNLQQARFDKDFPSKPQVREALVTKIKSDEDVLRESQGSTGESDEQWLDIGEREREFLKKHAAKSSKG